MFVLCLCAIFGKQFFFSADALKTFIIEVSILIFSDLIIMIILNCFIIILLFMSFCCSVYTFIAFLRNAPREFRRGQVAIPRQTQRFVEKLRGQNLDMRNCEIDLTNVGCCVVGESSCLSIKLANGKSEPYKLKGHDSFSAKVTRTSNDSVIPIVVEPAELKDVSSIRVSFTCYSAGEYVIEAAVSSRKFHIMPLHHCAMAGPPHPGKSFLDLKSEFLVLTDSTQARISVYPRDQFENEADMEPEKLELQLVDSSQDVPVYCCSVERDLVVYITVFECGLFTCCLRYDGVKVGIGDFTVIVLAIKHIKRLEVDIENDNPLSLSLSITNLETNQIKRKISCQVTPKQVTFTEYYLIFFPSRIATFRLRPATQLNIEENECQICINDGKQAKMNLTFKDEVTRHLFIAYFNKFLLKNLGGSSDFEEKKLHFYRKLQEVIKSKRDSTHYINVSRDSLLKDMLAQSKELSKNQWYHRWHVSFKGEEGLDYGGVSRELFGVLSRQLFSPEGEHKFFVNFEGNSNPLSHPNPAMDVKQHERVYILIGQVIGKCLIESAYTNPIFLEARLTRSFLAQLLGLRVYASYFESDDKALFRGKIQYIQDTEDVKDVEDLEQYFVEEEFASDGTVLKTVPLKPEGDKIRVTQANKLHYLDLLADYRLCKRVKEHMELVCRGLYELVPDTLLSVFDESELELLICGVTTYDIKEWKLSIKICTTDKQVFPTLLSWFWTLAESLPEAERARIVQFTTGSSQLPPGGFASLSPSFQIGLSPARHKLPSAHTCFNQLLLPNHSTYEEFKSKFLLAIQEGSEGFGMI